MNITDAIATDWQISVTGPGNLAQNADDINQCLNIILSTQKGSDPLRYDFGIDLLSFIDKPVDVQAPALVRQIITQVAAYEPRIDLNTVNYSFLKDGGVVFALTWRYKLSNVNKPGQADTGVENTYFLLADQNGFIILSDFDVSIIVN